MYYDYFGLNQPPFRITPDTSIFFPGGNRGAILNAMIYAIVSGEGIVKVVGEVGSGKTMLCRMLAVELPEKVEVVYLANPNLSPEDILRAIAIELKLAVTGQDDRLRVMQSLQQYLLKRHAENCQVVIFVEEAQSMPLATLEEIRLLSNLETRQHKLLQIVLFGQPELDQMIATREIRQLKERITYSFYLNPLNNHEIRDYLNTRLRACGYRGGEIFNTGSIREIARYSRGLLRRINILADKALLAAYASNLHKVNAKQVRIAAKDSEFVAGWQHMRLVVSVAGALLVLLLAVWWIPFDQLLENFRGWLSPVAGTTVESEMQTTTDDPTTATYEPTPETVATIYHQQHEIGYGARGSRDETINPSNAAVVSDSQGDENTLQAESSMHPSEPVSQESVDKNITEEPDVATQTIPVTDSRQQLADYLLDEEHYAQVIETGEPLSRDEADLLIRQLRLMPPENGHYAGTETECRLCTSIIYRPLIKPESL